MQSLHTEMCTFSIINGIKVGGGGGGGWGGGFEKRKRIRLGYISLRSVGRKDIRGGGGGLKVMAGSK